MIWSIYYSHFLVTVGTVCYMILLTFQNMMNSPATLPEQMEIISTIILKLYIVGFFLGDYIATNNQ